MSQSPVQETASHGHAPAPTRRARRPRPSSTGDDRRPFFIQCISTRGNIGKESFFSVGVVGVGVDERKECNRRERESFERRREGSAVIIICFSLLGLDKSEKQKKAIRALFFFSPRAQTLPVGVERTLQRCFDKVKRILWLLRKNEQTRNRKKIADRFPLSLFFLVVASASRRRVFFSFLVPIASLFLLPSRPATPALVDRDVSLEMPGASVQCRVRVKRGASKRGGCEGREIESRKKRKKTRLETPQRQKKASLFFRQLESLGCAPVTSLVSPNPFHMLREEELTSHWCRQETQERASVSSFFSGKEKKESMMLCGNSIGVALFVVEPKKKNSLLSFFSSSPCRFSLKIYSSAFIKQVISEGRNENERKKRKEKDKLMLQSA